MISFRFHIVSLTAVFLALAVGIGIGATVVDQATVDTIKKQLESVNRRATSTNQQNDRLRADNTRWSQFGEQGAAALVGGTLTAPVVVVSVQGIDRKPLDALRQTLVTAGARLQGTVWFTSKLKLANPDDVRTLQALIGSPLSRPDLLRRALATRLAETWGGASATSLLPSLRDAGFLDFEPPSGAPVDLATVPPPGALTVVISDGNSDVPNAEVSVPFVTALVQRAPNRVLAAEAGTESTPAKPTDRAVFLRPLLDDAAVANALSTVDNIEDIRGRIATVLALAGLVDGRTGHYGVGRGAEQLVPPVGR
jgi:hypothetical protein